MANIIVTTKSTTLTEGLGNYLNQKLGKLNKYLYPDSKIYVKIEVKSGGRHKVEVTIPVDAQTIRAEITDTDMYAAIDQIEAVLARNLRKHKEKVKRQIRRTYETFKGAPIAEEANVYEIVRAKEHELCSMTEQEACEEMEMTGHDFYVYCDSNRNDQVCVVYVREDGKYGVLSFK